MHHLAEQDGHDGAQHAQPRRLDHGQGGQGRCVGDGVAHRGVEPAHPGKLKGDEGGQHAGHHGRIVHHAHADHLHGEDGGGEGSAEQGGEGGGHAAHDHDPAVLGVQSDLAAQPRGQRAAQLQSRSLAPGGAAHQVGEDGGEVDEGSGAQLHGLGLPHGHQHQIGAPVLLHVAGPVEQHDGHAAQGQEEDHVGVGPTQLGGPVDAIVEGDGHPAHHDADEAGIEEPFQKDQILQHGHRRPLVRGGRLHGFLSYLSIGQSPPPGKRRRALTC